VSANLELKAPVADPEAFRQRAFALATRYLGVDEQVDTYFRVPVGRLKLRESSRSGGQLVPYLRPDHEGARRSDYQVIPVADPEGAKALFAALLGVHRVVRKRREVWLHENVRIHLDAVEGLGSFMELEAVFDGSPEAEPEQRARIDRLVAELGLTGEQTVRTSYESLLNPHV